MMNDAHRKLYAELATALGISDLSADETGAAQITIGDDLVLVLFVENELTVTIVAPVTALPPGLGQGRFMWLLRRNHYDSPIAPFRISCNPSNNLTIWGRVPIEGLSGAELARMLDDVAHEVLDIREELGIKLPPPAAKATLAET